jgi:hypothetical protein
VHLATNKHQQTFWKFSQVNELDDQKTLSNERLSLNTLADLLFAGIYEHSLCMWVREWMLPCGTPIKLCEGE